MIGAFQIYFPKIKYFPADSGNFFDDMKASNILEKLSEKFEKIEL